MATVALSVFMVLLIVALAWSIRSPALALLLGIATYGLEQIASIIVPFFALHQSAFNILMGVVLGAALIHAVSTRANLFYTRDGFDVSLLVWIFLGLFWTSTLWSPAHDVTWVIQSLPYFLLYVFGLPLLVEAPAILVNRLRVLWVLLSVGLLGTMLSPALLFSLAMGRVVISATGGEADTGANPLAFADTAALLALTALLLLMGLRGKRLIGIRAWLVPGALLLSVVMALWLAFISGRGETIACITCGAAMMALVHARSLSETVRRGVMIGVVVSTIAVVVYARFEDLILAVSPRFSPGHLLLSFAIRGEYQTACFNAGVRSVATTIIGLGANGCQTVVGLYPHNEIVEALAETGIIGVVLLLSCYFFVMRFGVRTLAMARAAGSRDAVLIVAYALSLLLYNLILSNERGTLTAPDTYMWLAVSAMIFDRARASLREGPEVMVAPRPAFVAA